MSYNTKTVDSEKYNDITLFASTHIPENIIADYNNVILL